MLLRSFEVVDVVVVAVDAAVQINSDPVIEDIATLRIGYQEARTRVEEIATTYQAYIMRRTRSLVQKNKNVD